MVVWCLVDLRLFGFANSFVFYRLDYASVVFALWVCLVFLCCGVNCFVLLLGLDCWCFACAWLIMWWVMWFPCMFVVCG